MKRPRKQMVTSVAPLNNGGVRITVSDEDTDTLAIFEVRSDGDYDDGSLMAVTRLRGNTDAHERPVHKTVSFIDAPRITGDRLRERKRDYMRRNAWRNH